jgi:hypothetical protein
LTDTQTENQDSWVDNRTLVIAWLMVFFPVGLYGLWKGNLFDRNWKIGITVLVAALFLVAGINFTNPIYVFALFPGALVLMWRDAAIARKVIYRFAACWPVVVMLFLYEKDAALGTASDLAVGGSCSAVMTEGNCTYYRDSDCNVIARQCE